MRHRTKFHHIFVDPPGIVRRRRIRLWRKPGPLPAGRQVGNAPSCAKILWTWGESNPQLGNANAA